MTRFGDQPSIDKLLSLQEAGQILNYSRSGLYGLVARNELSVIKVGRASRIRASDLAKFIDSRPTVNASREAGQ